MLGGLGFDKFCCAEGGVVSPYSDTTPPLFNIDADGDFQPYAQGRVSEYEMDIYFYSALIGSNWKDGWIFPVLASSVNPYHQGSKSFNNLAIL